MGGGFNNMMGGPAPGNMPMGAPMMGMGMGMNMAPMGMRPPTQQSYKAGVGGVFLCVCVVRVCVCGRFGGGGGLGARIDVRVCLRCSSLC